MNINRADVAELVDARDLKFPAPHLIVRTFCKTDQIEPGTTARNPRRLQNNLEASMAREELVYFMMSSGLIKVGRTQNIMKRWNELNDSSATYVHLLFTLDGGMELERRIHARFAADDLLSFIEKMDELRKPGSTLP